MDDPALDRDEHHAALRGLARINRLSGADGILLPPIRALGAKGSLSVLDLATGSGDVPIALHRRAGREGLKLSIRACDVSPRAVEAARGRAHRAGAPIDFFVADALGDGSLPEADVVTSSLFLHHLDDADAARLLTRMQAAARRLVLINDLRRCARGLALAWLVPRLLTTSRVVHVDAVRSVEAGFTIDELRTLARNTGLEGAVVAPRFPARMLLTWRRAQ